MTGKNLKKKKNREQKKGSIFKTKFARDLFT